MNDATNLEDWEHTDPLGALCRRIAFAALGDKSIDFDKFRATKVTPEQILEWLGNTPCLLLIDELNIMKPTDEKVMAPMADFLKENFLIGQGRYFVFSSHVTSCSRDWRVYLNADSPSSRQVIALSLPLAPRSLNEITQWSNWPGHTPQSVLYCGMIPALLYMYGLRQIIPFLVAIYPPPKETLQFVRLSKKNL